LIQIKTPKLIDLTAKNDSVKRKIDNQAQETQLSGVEEKKLHLPQL
jgi:hypothetical protein